MFPTRAALQVSAHKWAANHGYAVVDRNSDMNRVILKCNRGGVYRNRCYLPEATRKRKTSFYLTNCLFRLQVMRDRTLGCWSLHVVHAAHNQSASKSITAHPSLRKLDTAEQQQVATLSAAHVQLRTNGAVMRDQGQGETLLMKDIFNARQTLRRP